MSTDKQEAAVAESKPQGRFPKFIDKHEWKVLLNENAKGENDQNKIIWYRVTEQSRKKIDLEIKAVQRPQVVSRRIREILDGNQHAFGIQGAGVTMFGGCLPLYKNQESEKPCAYTQGYRFTLRIV